jgi:hypothetical protein
VPSESALLALRSLVDTALVGSWLAIHGDSAEGRFVKRQVRESDRLLAWVDPEGLRGRVDLFAAEAARLQEVINRADENAGMPDLFQIAQAVERELPGEASEAATDLYAEIYSPLSNLVAHTSSASLSRYVSMDTKRLRTDPFPVAVTAGVLRGAGASVALLSGFVAREAKKPADDFLRKARELIEPRFWPTTPLHYLVATAIATRVGLPTARWLDSYGIRVRAKMKRPRRRTASARDQLAEALRTSDFTRKVATRGRIERKATNVLESRTLLSEPEFWVAALVLMAAGVWNPEEMEGVLRDLKVGEAEIAQLQDGDADRTG